jgi:hypothetical protein
MAVCAHSWSLRCDRNSSRPGAKRSAVFSQSWVCTRKILT